MPSDAAPPAYGGRDKPEATADTRWYVQLLGGLLVAHLPSDRGGAPVPPEVGGLDHAASPRFETHKAALLFARLLLYPHRAHGRDALADWLWPDSPADKGRANLSQTLRRLKLPFASGENGDGALSVPLLTADHQTVRLRAGVFQTDVALFERRVREAEARNASPAERAACWKIAVESYGGDLLPGFYDDWIERERQRLRELFDRACAESRAAAHAAETVAPESPQQPQTAVAAPRAVGFPLTLTRFFGRDAERADLCARLTDSASNTEPCLITLTGAGGMGKTRLALQATRQTGDTFVFAAFASLAEVSDTDHIAAALLQLLSPKAGDDSHKKDEPFPLVVDALHRAGSGNGGGGRVLLVLDNLEQFGTACAPLVSRLLAGVPALTVLATSRQPVGVAGEQEILLGPLVSTNAESGGLSPDVQLFVDRARLVRPQFALTPQNETAVRALCQLLEGVPLAIELAAAWVRTLSPAQIIERLCYRFDLLQRRGAAHSDLPKRHQSLHATIAWSYDLLPPNLQTFWAQLSIFRGGWTADAARAVTGINDVAEPLLLLAERSLILMDEDETTGEVRYRMLESIREFAYEQGEAMGRDFHDGVCLRHAQYFEQLSRQGEQIIQEGSGNRPAMALLGPERDNIRAALRFTLEISTATNRADDAVCVTGIRLVLQSASLRSVGEQAAYLQQAAALTVLLPDETGLPLRAQVLSDQGHIATFLGDFVAAKQKISESSALWEALGEEEESITNKKRLSAIAWRTGNAGEALSLLTECLDAARRNNDPKTEAGILNNLAVCGSGRPERWDWITRSVALYREHMPHSYLMAMALNSMGGIALQNGDFETARPYLEEAHDLAVAEGAAGMMGVSKEILAKLFLTTGQNLDRAARLLQEAQQIFEEKGEPPRVAEAHRLSFHVALKRGDLPAALGFACDYLTVSRDAHLMDEAQQAEAQDDLTKQLRDAGCSAPVFFGAPVK